MTVNAKMEEIMLVAGMTQMQVAKHLDVSRTTIVRLMILLRDTDSTNHGRLREIFCQDRHIRIIYLRNLFVSSSQTALQIHERNNK